MLKLKTILSRLGACDDARKWAKDYDNLQSAWANCKRSDWMLWLIGKTVVDPNDPRLRLMACDFAEAVLIHVHEGEGGPRMAIEVVRRYATGEATSEELAAAWDAASDAAWDAASDAARAAASDAQSDTIRRYFPECPAIKPELLKVTK